MLLASCVNGNREYDEADYSAFGTFVHALDTTEQRQYLTHLLDADSSRWEADKTVRKYYAERTHEPLWYTREGVTNQADSLLTQLQRELPQHGLNPKAFFLSEIEDDLEIVHKLAFDSVGQSINEVLPRLDYHLSKAYVRYTVGQRYGFIRPTRCSTIWTISPTARALPASSTMRSRRPTIRKPCGSWHRQTG